MVKADSAAGSRQRLSGRFGEETGRHMASAAISIHMTAAPWRGGGRSRDCQNLIEKSLDQDSSLVERCLSGEDAAWEDLVRIHTRRVYGLCYRFTRSNVEAQDLTQEVFLRIFCRLRSFRSAEGSFGTWLTRLTRNLLIDHYRRTRHERVTDSIEEQLPMLEEHVAASAL